GLRAELELATLRRALDHSVALPDGLWLSLNVSPSLIVRSAALQEILATVARTIVLEITEQEAIDDYAAVRTALERLGTEVLLSVDDAGSGFASLRHVLSLRPSYIKLDRSWIHAVDIDPSRQALIAGLQHFS